MHINNLGGARMPTTTSVGSSSSTARTSFSSLVQGGSAAPAAGRAVPGSSIVSTAIGISHGGVPGSGFNGPYLGTTPAKPGTQGGATPVHTQAPGLGIPSVNTTVGQPQAPGLTGTPGAPGVPGGTVGSEFNGELKAMYNEQKMQEMKALKELAKMSLISFVSGTFGLGQNQQKLEQESF
jgi:hypothetical protein